MFALSRRLDDDEVDLFEDRLIAENRAIEAREEDPTAALYTLKNGTLPRQYDIAKNRWYEVPALPDNVLSVLL